MSEELHSLFRDFADRVRSSDTLPIIHKPFGTGQLHAQQVLEPINCPGESTDTPIKKSVITRACDIVNDAIRHAIGMAGHKLRPADLEKIARIIDRRCEKIIDAATNKPRADRITENEKERKAAARHELALALRGSKNKLQQLKNQITAAENRARNAESEARKVVDPKARDIRKAWAAKLIRARERLRSLENTYEQQVEGIVAAIPLHRDGYPEIPAPTVTPEKDVRQLPNAPGIYFLWKNGVIEYIGQASRLSSRVKLGAHHVLDADHRISYVLVEAQLLSWAECYYIGIARPYRNFGAMAAHARYAGNNEK